MKNLLILLILILISSYFISGCGSAEAISYYDYPITKDSLEKSITHVLKYNNDSNLKWDTTNLFVRRFRKIVAQDDNRLNTIFVDRYKGTFVWLTITDHDVAYHYDFRYSGSEEN
jgi:hypothetical protein